MHITELGHGIRLVHNFIDNDLSNQIIQSSNNNFAAAGVYDNTKKTTVIDSHFRNAEIYYVPDSSEQSVQLKQSIVSFMNVRACSIEPLQCVKYESGGQYKPHFDAFFPGTYPDKIGNRTHTIIVYLNDDFGGGQTYFPNLGITINPVKNSAVIWENIDANKNIKNDSLHAGLPVIYGTKYIIPIWVREYCFYQ